ncbi:MAG: DNA/RNA non-specific endonuclease [Candidatus Rifleibacteriota bacterium]
MKFRHRFKQGKIGPNQLIIIILLLTAIGIGGWYYIQYQQQNVVIEEPGHWACPVESQIVKARREAGGLVYGGLPKADNKLSIAVLKNTGFWVGYSNKKQNPLWVAYRIDANKQRYELKRPSGFKTDYRTTVRVNPNSYKHSGYDRGHLAPNSAISDQYGRDAQLQSFKMSNICPQSPDLNRKLWKRLENLESKYAQNFETVWVITGPVFDEHIERLKKGVEIPDALYKIIFDEQEGNIRALAFLVPQSVSGYEPLDKFLTSIDEIEEVTKLDFLAPLSDENEDKFEAGVANSLW